MSWFQSNFSEVFLLWPFTKIAKIIPLGWTKWPPELKIEKKQTKKTITLNVISFASGLISKWFHRNVPLIPPFFFFDSGSWKFQHFNLVSKIQMYLKNCWSHCLETWQVDREYVNDLITAVNSVEHFGPWASCYFFCFCPFIPLPLSASCYFFCFCPL